MSPEERFNRLVAALQNAIADANVAVRYRRVEERDRKLNIRGRRYRLVRNLPSLTVRMDGTKNHARPHVHCDIGFRRHAASIAIDSGEVLAGKLTRNQEREIQRWVRRHRKALLQLWDQMQGGRDVETLICRLKSAKA